MDLKIHVHRIRHQGDTLFCIRLHGGIIKMSCKSIILQDVAFICFQFCGERGITFGDPLRFSFSNPNYSLTRFTRMVFLFSSVLDQASLFRPSENKNPKLCLRSNLALRREGDSNPRFRDCRTTVFETAAFDHSAISPIPIPIILSRIDHGVYPAQAGPSLLKQHFRMQI